MQPIFFNSEEEIMNYVTNPLYEKHPDFPGLCAAISYTGVGDDHVFKFHFDDQDHINYTT